MPWIWAGFIAASLLLLKGVTTLIVIGRRLPTMLLPPPAAAEFARVTRGIWSRSRRAVVALVGGTVLLVGIALVVLPGPASLVVPLGLAILATEFVWARRLLTRIKDKLGLSRSQADSASAAPPDGEVLPADPPPTDGVRNANEPRASSPRGVTLRDEG